MRQLTEESLERFTTLAAFCELRSNKEDEEYSELEDQFEASTKERASDPLRIWVAVGQKGGGLILGWDGGNTHLGDPKTSSTMSGVLQYEIENVGYDLEEHTLNAPDIPGLYIFTGTLKMWDNSSWEHPDTEYIPEFTGDWLCIHELPEST